MTTRYHDVKLELVRPGPPHNQLLSPLTPYMALCGEGSPITFHMELEHHQLLNRLERLRYVTSEGLTGVAVPDRVREATVAEMGSDVGQIFGKLSTLLAEAWRAIGDKAATREEGDSHLVHLRLILAGSELSLIPFEMAVSPQGFPGEGLELALQLQMGIVMTREVRRSRPMPVAWDTPQEPRILLVSASPAGMTVPLEAHVTALRGALEPWVPWPDPPSPDQPSPDPAKQRLPLVKERLRVMPDATINAIYELCSKESFTHVHILAHGAYKPVAGERRFGVALCQEGNPERVDVVDGKSLAKALQAEGDDGVRRSQPVLVTLATCDSGSPGSVLVPGGSIAHDLHAAGIPWVFASQFPLTKVGSVRLTRALYPRLLRGDDPRQSLFEVRRQLMMHAERDHDWASLVAYSSVPPDFEDQVTTFFERQMRWAISVSLRRADGAPVEEMEEPLIATRGYLELWRNRLPQGNEPRDRARRVECFGMHGSTWKRIGLMFQEKGQKKKGRNALEQALGFYRKAMDEWAADKDLYHWVATQALSLGAVLGKEADLGTYLMARRFAEHDLSDSDSSVRAWGHGTLAELEMIGPYHQEDYPVRGLKRRVRDHCGSIVRLMGEDSFHVQSTRRQFQRYVDHWRNESWVDIARAAVRALSPPGREDETQLPHYA